MKKLIYSGLLIAILMFTVTPSFAKLKISPSIKLREVYNDNIFLSKSDEKDDFITHISPKIELDYKTGKSLDLNLDYGFYFIFHDRYSNENETDIGETQRLKLIARARPVNHVFIDIFDIYQKVTVDARSGVVEENAIINVTDSNVFTISPFIEYPLTSSLISQFGYRFSNAWYKVDEGDDSDIHTFFLSVTKRFPFGIDVSLNYDFLVFRPKITIDYNKHHGYLKVHYQVNPKLRVWGEVGEEYIYFKELGNESITSWSVGSELIASILGGTSVEAEYSETLSELLMSVNQITFEDNVRYYDINTLEFKVIKDKYSITTGLTKRKGIDLKIITGKNIEVVVNPYYFIMDELKTSREDEITGINVKIKKELYNKIMVNLYGIWEEQRFLPSKEKVERYSLGSDVNYRLSRSILTGIGYRYSRRISNIDIGEYRSNIFWVQAKITF